MKICSYGNSLERNTVTIWSLNRNFLQFRRSKIYSSRFFKLNFREKKTKKGLENCQFHLNSCRNFHNFVNLFRARDFQLLDEKLLQESIEERLRRTESRSVTIEKALKVLKGSFLCLACVFIFFLWRSRNFCSFRFLFNEKWFYKCWLDLEYKLYRFETAQKSLNYSCCN